MYNYINSYLGNNPLIISDKNNKAIKFLVNNCCFVIRKGKEGRLYFHVKWKSKSVEIKFYDIDVLWGFALSPSLGYAIPGKEGCEFCGKSVFNDCKCEK